MTQALTPPQYQNKHRRMEDKLLLEERLWEFVKWLQEREIKVCVEDYALDALIQEYVNT